MGAAVRRRRACCRHGRQPPAVGAARARRRRWARRRDRCQPRGCTARAPRAAAHAPGAPGAPSRRAAARCRTARRPGGGGSLRPASRASDAARVRACCAAGVCAATRLLGGAADACAPSSAPGRGPDPGRGCRPCRRHRRQPCRQPRAPRRRPVARARCVGVCRPARSPADGHSTTGIQRAAAGRSRRAAPAAAAGGVAGGAPHPRVPTSRPGASTVASGRRAACCAANPERRADLARAAPAANPGAVWRRRRAASCTAPGRAP